MKVARELQYKYVCSEPVVAQLLSACVATRINPPLRPPSATRPFYSGGHIFLRGGDVGAVHASEALCGHVCARARSQGGCVCGWGDAIIAAPASKKNKSVQNVGCDEARGRAESCRGLSLFLWVKVACEGVALVQCRLRTLFCVCAGVAGGFHADARLASVALVMEASYYSLCSGRGPLRDPFKRRLKKKNVLGACCRSNSVVLLSGTIRTIRGGGGEL